MAKERLTGDKTLMRRHLEPTVSEDGISSLDRVRLKKSGWYVWALAKEYKEVPKIKKSEGERLEYVARQYHISSEEAGAGIVYAKKYEKLFDARIFQFSLNADTEEERSEEILAAEKIIKDAEGKIDTLFPEESVIKF